MNPSLDVGTRRDPLGISDWRSVAHRIVITSQVPVHSVLVQKSVTTITNFAGRLSGWMLGNARQIRKRRGAKSWHFACLSPRCARPILRRARLIAATLVVCSPGRCRPSCASSCDIRPRY